MTKVKLSKEVAEDITEIRRLRSDSYLLDTRNFLGQKACVIVPYEYEGGKIAAFLAEDITTNLPIYMSALVNGYEVEKSPEELEAERKENVREYYEKFSEPSVGRFVESEQYVIAKTLNLLGITIEGINDKEESE